MTNDHLDAIMPPTGRSIPSATHASACDPQKSRWKSHRALVDRLPKPQGAALRARLDLDALEPGLHETLAGLRCEVNGTAYSSDGLRTAIAARLADQQATPLPAT
ncbi:hypothetical protein ACFVT2_41955 [Streptomyces sp. NPDC058000]|uniref:hypothetical protein n=1 Tax=Streptomyces sp. NPDC058000 TaxID=3346299 RepID=UPI0036E4E94A